MKPPWKQNMGNKEQGRTWDTGNKATEDWRGDDKSS